MQDEAYLNAIEPEPVVCLKLPLLRFSIGHKELLHRRKSPFVLFDREPTEGDLRLAVWICSSTYEEIATPSFLSILKLWVWKTRLKLTGSNWFLDVEIFKDYIRNGIIEPNIRPVSSGRAMGAPWTWRLQNFLKTKRGKTDSEAINFSYAKACWDFCGYYETEGALEIRNAEDIEFLEWCKEQDRLASEGGKECLG